MAIIGANVVRESTKREIIDRQLLETLELARNNDQGMLQLRNLFLGAPPDDQRPERSTRPGWFGEIQDGLESINEYMENTAKALEEIHAQVGTSSPTMNPLSRG